MYVPLVRAHAIFKSRSAKVLCLIKPKFQSIRLNSVQQNYAAVTSISLSINKEEAGRKCGSFQGSMLKDITKPDLVVLGCNTPYVQRSKNNAQIYTTSRSFSLQSMPPPSSEKPPSAKPPSAKTPSAKTPLPPSIEIKPTKTEQLKHAFKEYGPAIMGFHLAISMISLGGLYLVISGGIDLEPILEFLGISSNAVAEKVATGSTFVVALAIHKILAPIRISITLGATPFVVRYLRSKGLMKAKTKTL